MGWTALLDDADNEIGVVGDTSWDIMGEAFEMIIKEYQKKWGRSPNSDELISIFNFTLPDGYEDILCRKVSESEEMI